MLDNPFHASFELSMPLRLEVCQQIHVDALAAVMSAKVKTSEVPSSVDPIVLRERVRSLGSDASLLHPTTIEQIFAGVTLAVYLTVQHLYCSRIGRRVRTVWTIINAMAQHAQASPISYEAIWALCLFLQKRRMQMTRVAIQRMAATWWIIFLPGEVDVNGEEKFPSLVCVFDETSRLVIAFRARMSLSLSETSALALHDALVLHRYPYREVPAAVIWYTPERLIVDDALPWTSQNCCSRLGLPFERQCTPPFAQTFRQQWMREVAVRHLKPRHWLSAFDSYLHKAYGYSPRRLQEEHDRDYASLVGYTRDPSWNLPVLRTLLPCSPSTITAEGTIIYQGNIYRDDLLSYWPGAPVTIRSSQPPGTSLWVYLYGELLCQANAQVFRPPLSLNGTQRER